MAWHVVSDLIFDEHNEREMARHGVVRHDVDQIIGIGTSSPPTATAKPVGCC